MRVTEKGQVTIPKELRDQLGLGAMPRSKRRIGRWVAGSIASAAVLVSPRILHGVGCVHRPASCPPVPTTPRSFSLLGAFGSRFAPDLVASRRQLPARRAHSRREAVTGARLSP